MSVISKSAFRSSRYSIKNAYPLGAIVILALVLRLFGVNFGLPHLYHADEPIVVNHALAFGTGDFNPHFFKIPPLASYLLFIAYGFYFAFGKLGGLFSGIKDFEFLFYGDPTSFYLIARTLLGVLPGTAAVYVLFRLTRKHFSESCALLSALLLAVCFLHVRDSHYSYVDILLNLVLISSFFIFFKLLEGPSSRNHFISGILIGLALAVKYNGFALVFPYFYCAYAGRHVILPPLARSARGARRASLPPAFRGEARPKGGAFGGRPTGPKDLRGSFSAGNRTDPSSRPACPAGRQESRRGSPRLLAAGGAEFTLEPVAPPRITGEGLRMTKFLSGVLIMSVASMVTFVLLNPFAVLDFDFFLQDIRAQAGSQGGTPWYHHLTYSLAGGAGWPILIMAAVGMARLVFHPEPKRNAFAIFILVYYVILCRAGQLYDRYVLPLVPFLIFFAADTLLEFSGRRRKEGKTLLYVGILLLALPGLVKSILWDRVMIAKDVRTLAKEWVESHIPSGSSLALGWDFYMPRFSFFQSQLEEKRKELMNDSNVSKSKLRKIEFLLSRQTRKPSYHLYFLAENPKDTKRFLFAKPLLPYDLKALKRQGIDYVLLPIVEKNTEPAFYQALLRKSHWVAEFNPYRNSSRKSPIDAFTLTGGPFLFAELCERERNGHMIRVFEL